MKKILILTSKTGGGHESLAQAIKEELEKEFQIEIFDGLPTLAAKIYGFVHLYLPTFFNLAYRLADNKPAAKILHFFSFLLTYPSLRKINFEDFDLILSVQPFLTEEIAWLKPKKFIIFIADPVSISQVWLCPKADLIFVATKEGKDLCLKKRLPVKKIVVSGFPVRQQFLKKLPKKEKSKFTILVGGSGYGVRETKEIIKNLKNKNIQIIAVCGRSKSLQKSLPQRKNIKIFGFVKNMAELMTGCHLIIGKAGPNLLFESITLGIPFLATGYPPEQEKGNIELIKKYQIGFVEENPQKAAELIKELAKNPEKLEKLKPNIKKLAKLHQTAPQIIASKISHLLKNLTTPSHL